MITISSPTYQDYAPLFKDMPKPCAYVDMDRLNANIAQVLAYAGDANIRIGSKSVRSRAILHHILDNNARFQGILAFTAPEAVWLAEHGFDDIVIAYPVWDASHIRAVAQSVKAGKTIVLMVDSLAHIKRINTLALASNVRLPLCIDIDMSTDHYGIHFGVWRSPVQKRDDILPLVHTIQKSEHVYLDGVMGYEAQIAGVADNAPKQALMNFVKRHLKARSMPQVSARRTALVNAIQDAGVSLRFVNAGGSGSIRSSVADAVVTEVTVGSAFYCPTLFSHYSDYAYQPSAGFVLEVVRQPKPDVYTCLGGGYIASGATGADKAPQPYLPQGAELIDLEGAGEVQTPIHYTGKEKLTLGSPVFMRHAKAGELCERFDALYCIQDGSITQTVPTYRGEGKCFL
jgi:D-serine deaminase-like pyridoxal phosphate-dependent protein